MDTEEYNYNAFTPLYSVLMFDCHIPLTDIDNSDFLYLLELYKYKIDHTETDNYNNNTNNADITYTKGIPED